MKSKINHLKHVEKNFPFDRLHEVALAQGNAKMPIYLIHKWWARRLGSIFRALIISSFHESDVREFWKKYYDGFVLEDKVIYDPFMGGGTTMIEGLRLGCKVIGCDINPVAWFVTKKEIDPFDCDQADKYFKILETSVGKVIQKLYETQCPKGHAADALYNIWIRLLKCTGCGQEQDLFGNLIIRNKNSRYTIFCPKCRKVYTNQSTNLHCPKRHNLASNVVVSNGIFTCLYCKKRESIIDSVKKKGRPLDARIFCIEYYCKECNERGYKDPDETDLKKYLKAQEMLDKIKPELILPTQRILFASKTDRRPTTHGFTHFHQLFNDRQLLSLGLLLKEIRNIPDDNIREFFLLTLSASVETNNVLCKYETNWGKVSALFGIPTYHVPERYAENNLWGIGRDMGRGTFVRNYEKLKRGKKYGLMPYERIYTNKKQERKRFWKGKQVGLRAVAKVTTGEFNWNSDWRAVINCMNAEKVDFIPEKAVDVIVTDPPYFETIRYSELADFFYVWLRLGLEDKYIWFRPETSQQEEEVIAHSTEKEDREIFVHRLTKVFQHANYVLKDDGLMVFTFHHTKQWAWQGLKKSLTKAGFYVTATPIIRSEGVTGYRKGNFVGYDICVVCRKHEGRKLTVQQSISSVTEYARRARQLRSLGRSMTEPEILTIVMSDYLRADDDSAERIMNEANSLVKEIRKRIGHKDG